MHASREFILDSEISLLLDRLHAPLGGGRRDT
jgi:hypothetical protein